MSKSNYNVLTDSLGNRILISYKTVVAACIDGVYYETEKRWSCTTSKHINRFLDGNTAIERQQSAMDALLNFNRYN